MLKSRENGHSSDPLNRYHVNCKCDIYPTTALSYEYITSNNLILVKYYF